MPSQHTTIASASQPHIRHTDPAPRAPLTSEERQEKQAARKLKQEQIDAAVGEWFTYTYAKATELAERFGRTQRHFLDTFFQGGAHMVHHQENVNAYNAFKSEKAAECRERTYYFLVTSFKLTRLAEGDPKAAPELHKDFHAEYTALTEEEKQEYVDRFIDTRSREVKIRKATPRGRIQDLANTVRNMQLLVSAILPP